MYIATYTAGIAKSRCARSFACYFQDAFSCQYHQQQQQYFSNRRNIEIIEPNKTSLHTQTAYPLVSSASLRHFSSKKDNSNEVLTSSDTVVKESNGKY